MTGWDVHIAVASITPQCNAFGSPKPRVLNMFALYPIEAIAEWKLSRIMEYSLMRPVFKFQRGSYTICISQLLHVKYAA
jgi:hypothetical protein